MIARRGQVLLHATVGEQDPARGTPMALDSIFRIYSMTKPVVSVAIMMLMERGKLLLSDPVAKYLPEFANVQVMAHVNGHSVLHHPKAAPTVQDLLRHTSGLTYEIWVPSPSRSNTPRRAWPRVNAPMPSSPMRWPPCR